MRFGEQSTLKTLPRSDADGPPGRGEYNALLDRFNDLVGRYNRLVQTLRTHGNIEGGFGILTSEGADSLLIEIDPDVVAHTNDPPGSGDLTINDVRLIVQQELGDITTVLQFFENCDLQTANVLDENCDPITITFCGPSE